MQFLIGIPRKDKQGCRFFSVDVNDRGNATARAKQLFLLEATDVDYDWDCADVAERSIPVYQDRHVTITLLAFSGSAKPPEAWLAVEEHDANVGFYYINVRFDSGDATRIDYDGGNPNRLREPSASSSHLPDSLKEISALRIRD
jgi:hypothetical protein